MSNLTAALELAELGLPVFPVKLDKAPFTARGFKDATTNRGTVEAFWKSRSTANIGIATEALAVIDADGEQGAATLAALEAELGPLPKTCEQKTPKGTHRLYCLPAGVTVPSTVAKLGPGLDTRGKGGYIATGKGYAWTRPPAKGLAELPSKWIDRLTGKTRDEASDSQTSKLSELLADPPAEGERNNWLAQVAGHLAKELKYLDAFTEIVTSYGREVGLEEEEIGKLIRSIWGKEHAKPAEGPTSWAPVELQEILDGEYVQPEPTMLARTDLRCLIYPGRVHAWNAEPESLKTWLALVACAEQLAAGEVVLFIDFEDSAVSVIGRLRALGVATATIARSFIYLRPDEALTEPAQADFDRVLSRGPTLVVIDGMTEAYTREGLNPESNPDVAKWIALLPRHIVLTTDAAVVLLDHVVKDREHRGRYAIGAQHKLAGIDVALSLAVVTPLSRTQAGSVLVKVEKDRPGGIREFATSGGYVAAMEATPSELGKRVVIRLEPPKAQADLNDRPRTYMQLVSMAIEQQPGLSKKALRGSVKGGNDEIDLALELLVNEGFVEVRKEGAAHKHFSAKRYREKDDDGFQ
jgi:Bifunctional DNA primase/polymerase, N-terminal/AAA domain